jgi:general secretion pathway protein E
MQHEEAFNIHQLAISEGMTTMYEDGILKALQGLTSIEEVMRVTNEA